MNLHISEAHHWLGYLRKGTDEHYDLFINRVRQVARNGNLTLADIGTNEEELKTLQMKGCKIAAHMWLGYLRNGIDPYGRCIAYIRKEAHNGNLTLADIGTNEEELASLGRVPA